jgi:signal transduction histidine kinase
MDSKIGAVLFVDDENNILSSLKRTCRSESYACFYATSGQEALNILDIHPVNVVVTDMKMPGMMGEDLLYEIKQQHPNIVRLILSAQSDSSSLLKAINTGYIYRFITKPWDKRELKIIIRQALELALIQEEKRNLIEQLKEQNRMLEEKVDRRSRQLLKIKGQAEIGKYAAQLVHNLKNPLHAIMGTLDLTDLLMSKNDQISSRELAEVTHLAKKSANQLCGIIKGVLEHAGTARHFELAPVNVNQIIEEEMAFFDINPAFKTEIQKELDLHADLPPVLGDAVQIKQIIDNIVGNAIDAMASVEFKRLTIRTDIDSGFIVIEIEDTGEGIDPEDMDRIFNSDFTTKPIDKGTGLGLVSVKTMVDAYQGHVDVRSEKGQGTTFIIRLPAGQ